MGSWTKREGHIDLEPIVNWRTKQTISVILLCDFLLTHRGEQATYHVMELDVDGCGEDTSSIAFADHVFDMGTTGSFHDTCSLQQPLS
eukprot:10727501-Prorocentrum_lima.AAC.1